MSPDSPSEFPFPKLTLPPIPAQVKMNDGKWLILDALRKKHLVLTPEEWVRQHWIGFLKDHLGYPKGLFSLEKGMKYNQLSKRADLVIFDQEGKPYLLVECKAPEVEISEKTLAQAMAYNKTLQAPFIALSNGIKNFCFEYNPHQDKFFQRKTIPNPPAK